MKLTIMTAQTSVGRRFKDIALDITVKSGDKVFAPTWDMVMGHKGGRYTDAQYTEMYTKLMRKSWKENRARWIEVISQGEVLLLCYCPAGSFCHRHLLAEFLKIVAESRDIVVDVKGEIL